MTILIAGATGATGKHLVSELLKRGHNVKVIVRSAEKIPEEERNNTNLEVIEAAILDLSDNDMSNHVVGCEAIASCLGHNLSRKGIWGKPHRLVADATQKLCETVKANQPVKPVKFVLMNTAGNRNKDLNEKIRFGESVILGFMGLLLPPQVDNEQAAEYLRAIIGQSDNKVEWAAVRPDNLVNEVKVSGYEIHSSPIRSAIFNPGKTSRINVAHFMAELITNDEQWNRWKGLMPVIYNKE